MMKEKEPGKNPDEAPKFGHVIPIGLEAEMQGSYINYAMSVIVGRALPDVRDGLKPVHRRILYGMRELGLESNKPYKKSARIVGEVMGKYHPHGDAAIYATLCRMAQDFSLRCPLVDGQGNFGSIDGDSPAAMRYTEARMAPIAGEIMADIDKETVDWQANFDESLSEPTVMPSRLPNLMVNGSTGIAVGMATNIPPHNLAEVVRALILLLEKPGATVEEMMEVLPGPDFPSGGFIMGSSGIRNAYRTGHGLLTLQAKTHVENLSRGGREAIVITEIPYEVNKATLVSEIARLAEAKAEERGIDGISTVRDESDKEGMRIVIELKPGENTEVIQNQLFKNTRLRTSYGVINLALVDGRPQVLTLPEMLGQFINHRRLVITRRTRFELRKARERLHILEGYLKALDQIDEVIKLIRASRATADARQGLQDNFGLTEKQSDAVLAMPLSRLTGLEQEKIKAESDSLRANIEEYLAILSDPARVDRLIREELEEIAEKYGNPRRTVIGEELADVDERDLIKPESVVITVSTSGYIKRTALADYRRQQRGGRGSRMTQTKEKDYLKHMILANTLDYLLVFTDQGRVHWLPAYRIPEQSRQAKGRPIINYLRLKEKEGVAGVVPVRDFDSQVNLLFVTEKGKVKKTPLSAYSHPRSGGIIALDLNEDDRLARVRTTDGNHFVFLTTRKGKAICFRESDVRSMGRVAAGVMGIRLAPGDSVVGAETLLESAPLLTLTEKGYGKRTLSDHYRVQKRGGMGVLDIKTDTRNGHVVSMLTARNDEEVILLARSGQAIRIEGKSIRLISRNTRGVRLIKVSEGNWITDCVINRIDVPENGKPDSPAPGAGGKGKGRST